MSFGQNVVKTHQKNVSKVLFIHNSFSMIKCVKSDRERKKERKKKRKKERGRETVNGVPKANAKITII